jgi:hypothetical protein
MRLTAFAAGLRSVPMLTTWLALTYRKKPSLCAGAQRVVAELGLALFMPDTSPRTGCVKTTTGLRARATLTPRVSGRALVWKATCSASCCRR